MNKFNAFYYKQNGQEYISLVLPFYVINEISKVLVYGKDEYGYQRELSENHYKDIKKSLIHENIILPTSIILSVNREDIADKISQINSSLIELDIDLKEKLYRIVDGQHRLKGLEEAVKEKPELKNFMINVIILLTENQNRLVEVETFIDINSKAKKIKTDLTVLAKYNYEILGEKEINDMHKHMCIKVAYMLQDKIQDSVWKNAIKFDGNSSKGEGIIEVNAFTKSIASLVKTVIDKKGIVYSNNINEIDKVAYEVAKVISAAWRIVYEKWNMCFVESLEKDIDNNFIRTYYNTKYYIQKTTGANAISMILNDTLQEASNIDEGMNEFKGILKRSLIKSDDWLVGKKFSGLTSGSGFKKAKKFIMNEQ